MLCNCISHSEEEIEAMIIEGNYSDFNQFLEDTFIGSACGHCIGEVEKLFSRMHQ
ncbi:MAG: (2Fe-2S)-binding protein [Bacteroidales bacterium]|jgi:bacterioferritin-associated ferredoxin